jgi:hypothetical protein
MRNNRSTCFYSLFVPPKVNKYMLLLLVLLLILLYVCHCCKLSYLWRLTEKLKVLFADFYERKVLFVGKKKKNRAYNTNKHGASSNVSKHAYEQTKQASLASHSHLLRTNTTYTVPGTRPHWVHVSTTLPCADRRSLILY